MAIGIGTQIEGKLDLDRVYQVWCIGTIDSKADELRFISASVKSDLEKLTEKSPFKVIRRAKFTVHI